MKDVIKKVPIPLGGVMLGAAALGNLLQSYSEGIRYVCGIFAAFLLILVLLKLIMFPGAVKEDMGNPILSKRGEYVANVAKILFGMVPGYDEYQPERGLNIRSKMYKTYTKNTRDAE